MGNILNIARWELFKLPRRKMPWILLAILFVLTQLAVWGPYVTYTRQVATGGQAFVPFGRGGLGMPRIIRCNDLRAKPTEVIPEGTPPQAAALLQGQCKQQQDRLPTLYRTLTPPGSVGASLATTSLVGLILLGILAASTFGSEYGVGTLRPIMVRGVGRVSYLAGKFLALITAMTIGLVVVCAAAGLSGLLASHSVAPPPGAAVMTGSVVDMLGAFARTWGALVVYATLACSITILTRSTMAGMAVSLGYYIFESIFVRLMSAAFDWFEKVGDYLPMRNINALARATATASSGTNLPAAISGAGNDIGLTQAIIVASLYAIVFAAMAITVFRNRDIVGASGGG